MKYVYIVIGSEDGNIAATGSLKKAYNEARDYVACSCDGLTGEFLSLAQVRAKFKDGCFEVPITGNTQRFGDASIQRFEVL